MMLSASFHSPLCTLQLNTLQCTSGRIYTSTYCSPLSHTRTRPTVVRGTRDIASNILSNAIMGPAHIKYKDGPRPYQNATMGPAHVKYTNGPRPYQVQNGPRPYEKQGASPPAILSHSTDPDVSPRAAGNVPYHPSHILFVT